MPNKDRATGGDFPEFEEMRQSREKRLKKLKRLKNIKEILRSKKNTVLQPAPFYESMYGSQPDFTGVSSSPLEYYSGSIADGPDNAVNPWQNTYQSSATAASERKTRLEKRAIFWHNYA
jgi:hypothetical protein